MRKRTIIAMICAAFSGAVTKGRMASRSPKSLQHNILIIDRTESDASTQLRTNSACFRFVGFFAVRLIVWYFAYEFVLHFIHVHSIFNSPVEVVHRLSNYESRFFAVVLLRLLTVDFTVSAVAYVAGQLFYNKYVVMFGMPSLFAYLDGRPHNTEGVSTLRGALIGDLCSWM